MRLVWGNVEDLFVSYKNNNQPCNAASDALRTNRYSLAQSSTAFHMFLEQLGNAD
jgi:hypothetical protein